MNWALILPSAVIAAIVSSTLNWYFNWKLKLTDFKYDYKKYILKKRKKAYTEIEHFMTRLMNEGGMPPERESEPIKDVQKSLNKRMDLIREHYIPNIWTTRDLIGAFRIYNVALERLYSETIAHEIPPNLPGAIIRSHSVSYKELQQQYLNDIANLDDIDSFKNQWLDQPNYRS